MKDSKHVVMQGTSMAAPHVTGLLALMLQKKNSLDITTARSCLISSTGIGIWNKKNGYGKVNGAAAFNGVITEKTAQSVSEAHAFPSPARGNYVNISYRVSGDCTAIINIFNIAGERVSTARVFSPNGLNQYAYDIRGISQGVYFYQVLVEGGTAKTKMSKVAIIK
jgi:subtilisin family serine protease